MTLRPSLARLLVLGTLASWPASASPFAISYGGRLADANDVAVQGPVTLTLKFYNQASGGTALPVSPVTFPSLALDDGVFQVDVTQLLPAELQTVFGAGGDTWVEVTDQTHGVTYPRQHMTAVPYALKVPVDGKTVSYDANGNLTLVAGQPTAAGQTLVSDGNGNLSWATAAPATGVVQVQTGNKLPALDASSLTNLPAANLTGTIAPSSLPLLGASGPSHRAGLAPDPGSTPGTTRYLREDGSWSAPPIAGGTSIGGAIGNGPAPKSLLFLDASGNLAQDGAHLVFDTATARLGLGTASPGTTLDLGGALTARGVASPGASAAGTGRLYFDASAGRFLISENGGAFAQLASAALPNVGTPGTYLKVLTDAQGRVTGGATTLSASDLPVLPVSQITGTFTAAQIPALPAVQITGTLAVAQLPALPATQLVGTLAAAQLPALSVTQLVGTLAATQLPTLPVSQITGTFSAAQLPPVTAGAITSGTVAVANGGTGVAAFTNNGVVIGSGSLPLSTTGAGVNGQVLTVSGSTPVFGALNLGGSTAVTGTLPASSGGTGSNVALNGNRLMLSVGNTIVEAPALNNGQLLIGATGGAPGVATLSQGATHGVTITSGPGTLTLDTVQDLRPSAIPAFTGLSLASPSPGSLVKLGAGGTLVAAAAGDVTSLLTGSYVSRLGDGMAGPLTVSGLVQSTTGGFRFPDGTTQTTASGATSMNRGFAGGRLTLASGAPVPVTDVTGASTLFYSPYKDDLIGLYDGTSTWGLFSFSELSLTLGAFAANTNLDIFIYNNAGSPTLEGLAWTNGTTRSTTLSRQNGVYVKSTDTTRRYLGTVRIGATAGQSEDSHRRRFVWNNNNRLDRDVTFTDTTASSWTIPGTSVWTPAANTANERVEIVVGVPEDVLSLTLESYMMMGGTGTHIMLGISEDNNTSPQEMVMQDQVASVYLALSVHHRAVPAAGYHYYQWMEYAQATGVNSYSSPSSAGFRGVFRN